MLPEPATHGASTPTHLQVKVGALRRKRLVHRGINVLNLLLERAVHHLIDLRHIVHGQPLDGGGVVVPLHHLLLVRR